MISVVIPLFNKEKTIIQTLNSVLNQSFNEFEVIVVNDGSTDNSINVINENFNDERIIHINQSNQGVSAARNNGVKVAKYDFIAFLDGDDLWETNYLERIIETINLFPHAGLYCSGGIVRNSDGDYLRIAETYKKQICEIEFFKNPHVFLHTSASVIRKSILDKIGGFPVGMKRNEDYALFYSAALVTKVAYLGYPLSVYKGDVDGQATNTPLTEVLNDIIDRYNFVNRNYMTYNLENSFYKIFTKYELRHYIQGFIKNGDFKSLNLLLSGLDVEILKLFTTFEIKFYCINSFEFLKLLYIKVTKLRWRLRGYPRIKWSSPAKKEEFIL